MDAVSASCPATLATCARPRTREARPAAALGRRRRPRGLGRAGTAGRRARQAARPARVGRGGPRTASGGRRGRIGRMRRLRRADGAARSCRLGSAPGRSLRRGDGVARTGPRTPRATGRPGSTSRASRQRGGGTRLGSAVDTPQHTEACVIETLHTDRKSVDARSPVVDEPMRLDGTWIGLERDFRVGHEAEAIVDAVDEGRNSSTIKQARRTTADEQAQGRGPWLSCKLDVEITQQCADIGALVDVTAERMRVEITIRALTHTPGDVDVDAERDCVGHFLRSRGRPASPAMPASKRCRVGDDTYPGRRPARAHMRGPRRRQRRAADLRLQARDAHGASRRTDDRKP